MNFSLLLLFAPEFLGSKIVFETDHFFFFLYKTCLNLFKLIILIFTSAIFV